jgi:hypothetical protein
MKKELCVLALLLSSLPTQLPIEEINGTTTDAVLFTANLLYLDERRVLAGTVLLMNGEGEILAEKEILDGGYQNPIMFNETTILGHGERGAFLTLWNMDANKEYSLPQLDNGKKGHHEVLYNPQRNTFLTIGRSSKIFGNVSWGFDTLWEFTWEGEIIWNWDMRAYITAPSKFQCVLSNHTIGSNEYSHSNSIDWDFETNIIYLNSRHTDNVWAVHYPSGELLWISGRNGNSFTLF